MTDSIELARSYIKDALEALDMVEEDRKACVPDSAADDLPPGVPITGYQCRGGRGLLIMTANVLAATSGVPACTLSRFEMGNSVKDETVGHVLRKTLEEMGIEFKKDGWLRRR